MLRARQIGHVLERLVHRDGAGALVGVHRHGRGLSLLIRIELLDSEAEHLRGVIWRADEIVRRLRHHLRLMLLLLIVLMRLILLLF